MVGINGPNPGALTVYGDFTSGTADVIIDVQGYFAPLTTGTPDTYSLTLRDPQNRLSTKYNLSGGVATLEKDYVYLGNQLVATWQPASQPTPGYSFFMTDHLGTPRLQTDASANVVTRAKNRAFGLSLPLSGVMPQQGPEYASMEKDSASGNHYDHARFYTGWQGRFQVPDMLGGSPGDPQSWNRYAYARNNPLRFVDPDGRFPNDFVFRLAFGDPAAVRVAQAIGSASTAGPIVAGGAAAGGLLIGAAGAPALIPFAGQALLGAMVAHPTATTAGVAAVELAAGAFGAGSGEAPSLAALLKPAGDLIGRAGSSNSIRVIEGGAGTAEKLFKDLTQGGKVLEKPGYPGTLVELPGGGVVGFRPTSRSGPPTIDVNTPEFQLKIKILEDVSH
jgi:RHS repeat-associated protein